MGRRWSIIAVSFTDLSPVTNELLDRFVALASSKTKKPKRVTSASASMLLGQAPTKGRYPSLQNLYSSEVTRCEHDDLRKIPVRGQELFVTVCECRC